MSAKAGSANGGWEIKRVNSVTGPFVGMVMTDAIEKWNEDVPGQTTMIWSGPDSQDGPESECKFYKTSFSH